MSAADEAGIMTSPYVQGAISSKSAYPKLPGGKDIPESHSVSLDLATSRDLNPQQGQFSTSPVSSSNQAQCVCNVDANNYLCNGRKNLIEAYVLGLPLGFLGAHQFYLKRNGWGILYFFTFGFFGWGWAVDLLRMPWLVHHVNKQFEQCPECRTKRNLCDAYVTWFPWGIFGAHHFYLGRPVWGVAYMCTVGLLGLGWLVDFLRIPHIVKNINRKEPRPEPQEKSILTAYVLGLPPISGFFGAHHYYLGRYGFGILYSCTAGLLGVGYVFDWIRMPLLVKHANEKIKEGDTGKKYLVDAYTLVFPLGFLGLHQFYLHRYGWGILYIFTFGILGLGWISDWFRLPCMVSNYNKALEEHQSGSGVSNQGQHQLPHDSSAGFQGEGQGGVDNPVLDDIEAGFQPLASPPPKYSPYTGPDSDVISNALGGATRSMTPIEPPSYDQVLQEDFATSVGHI